MEAEVQLVYTVQDKLQEIHLLEALMRTEKEWVLRDMDTFLEVEEERIDKDNMQRVQVTTKMAAHFVEAELAMKADQILMDMEAMEALEEVEEELELLQLL